MKILVLHLWKLSSRRLSASALLSTNASWKENLRQQPTSDKDPPHTRPVQLNLPFPNHGPICSTAQNRPLRSETDRTEGPNVWRREPGKQMVGVDGLLVLDCVDVVDECVVSGVQEVCGCGRRVCDITCVWKTIEKLPLKWLSPNYLYFCPRLNRSTSPQ